MIMKKFLLILICLIFITTGCKQKQDNTLKFASWGSKTEVQILKSLISDFEKENPDIKVEFMHIPQNYFQKLHLMFASNLAPDVIFINNLNIFSSLVKDKKYKCPYCAKIFKES